ncbi:hypothetical protein JOQ06_027330 [Pogonophryne albipinna]|uniref:Mitochondrial import receptor subunit TOM34 n=1 Tax=Pogonophryne albipinna TaxID=1090488 RepID=A0AAD6BCM5_9TELE|nr:hypothetical protein JOQ06_027330 [Pogonophryne albipinna]
MPQKQRSKSWTELKQAGNESFKTGQYGEAINIYSLAIKELEKCNKKEPEDLGILYSNRAASYLKDGNCAECVKDCNMSLELFQFNVKSLLRRATAYEALERYRLAYVDYKTALQIDCNIAAAHDGTNRMTKALTEADGLSWREKLPPIPAVPMSVREKLAQKAQANAAPPNAAPTQNGTQQTSKPALSDKDVKKAQLLKEEGNSLVKKGEHKKAIEKALCYVSVKQYRDAIRDCDEALMMDSRNIKALYRKSQAYLGLKDIRACEDSINVLLRVEPNNCSAMKLLEEAHRK